MDDRWYKAHRDGAEPAALIDHDLDAYEKRGSSGDD